MADVVRAAALTSLRSAGVGVYRVDVTEGNWNSPWLWQVGIASSPVRTARMRIFNSPDSPISRLGDAMPRR